jgi:hypothetical protein
MKRSLVASSAAAFLALAALRGSSHAQTVGVPTNVQSAVQTNAQAARQLFGIYPAVVTSTQDPTQRGRLKLQIPVLSSTAQLWAQPSVPYVDGTIGSIKLPPVNSGVWVQFANGDPTSPVWVGWMPTATTIP